MNRKSSARPTLTIKGRQFKGLRGWADKLLHPPLTGIPIGLYLLAGVLDVASVIGGSGHEWARGFWHAGTYAFVGAVAVSVLAALTTDQRGVTTPSGSVCNAGAVQPSDTVTNPPVTPPAGCTTSPFSDVPISNPFCVAITYLKTAGITLGYAKGTFHPAADISRKAVAAFLYRLHTVKP